MQKNVVSILEDLRYKMDRIEKIIETLIDIYIPTHSTRLGSNTLKNWKKYEKMSLRSSRI